MPSGPNTSGAGRRQRPLDRPARWKPWVLGGLIVAATLVAYQPAMRGRFVWDDAAHVTRPELRSLDGLYRIWFEPGATQQYYPLLHSAFWVEHRLWGDATLGYHLVNVLLHAAAALLVAMILRRLAVPGAYLAAAIFALHPVHVDSVAWITEQKNTFSAVFYLGALAAYVRFDRTRTARGYLGALGLFVLALLSKTVTATLPGALLVILWWQRGTLSWRRDVLPILPFFVLGAAAGLFSAWVERTLIGAEGADFALTFVQRGLIAGRAVCFYLEKLFWPADLLFIYPRWTMSPAAWTNYLFPAGALVLLAAAWLLRRRSRGPLAGLLFFGGTLFPVLGFFNLYLFLYSFVADHFQYLASLGVIAVVSAGAALLLERWRDWRRAAGVTLCLALLATLGVLTWRQSRMYTDTESLFRRTIEGNPGCWMAYCNLGGVLAESGRIPEAIKQYQEALRLRPNNHQARNNLAVDLARCGRTQEAFEQYQEALRINPDYPLAHYNLANLLAASRRIPEAIQHYQQALRLKPDYPEARYNLGIALAGSGRNSEAIEEYQKALQLKPDYPEAHVNLGIALTRAGRTEEAIQHHQEALRLRPDFPEAHNNLGVALAGSGRMPEAVKQYREALRLKADYVEAYRNLGDALARMGKPSEAVVQYREALRLQPDRSETRVTLGLALAACGKTAEAIEEFRQALRLTPDYPEAHGNLGNALLKVEAIPEAVAHFRQALRLKPDWPQCLNNLAWLFATHPEAKYRDGAEAVRLAERACALTTNSDATMLDTLGAAYAEAGRFEDAAKAARRALELSVAAGQGATAEDIRKHLKCYEAGRPWREPSKP